MQRLVQWAFAAAFAGALVLGGGAAQAEDYPTKPIQWVVGYPPGGSTDICARLMGQ